MVFHSLHNEGIGVWPSYMSSSILIFVYGDASQLLFNKRIVGFFELQRSIRQDAHLPLFSLLSIRTL